MLWKNDGHILDLGILPGGTESLSVYVNDAGQVVGFSDNGVPDPNSFFFTGTQIRTFLWENGKMQDLGTIGGTAVFLVNNLNQQGEVVGGMNTAGDQAFHPFLWEGRSLKDLGTLGGDFGSANWVSETGEVIGWANTDGDQSAHAFLWRQGEMTDLGTVDGDPKKCMR